MLEAESGSVYRKLLIAVFAPRLLTRIEEQLHSGGNSDFLYEGLKAYLMLADTEHYDADFIKAWIALDWDRSLPRDLPAEQRQALTAHLQALFERRPPVARLDPRLVEDLRRQLQQMPVAQRVYDRIKRQKLPEGIPDFRINEAAGRDAALVFSRKSGKPLGEPLSGFFTVKGYRQGFLLSSLSQTGTLAEEQWVLGHEEGDQQNVASLAADVRRLYFQDYLRQWDALLADIDFVPITSVAQAADVLRVISGPTSPLKNCWWRWRRKPTCNRMNACWRPKVRQWTAAWTNSRNAWAACSARNSRRQTHRRRAMTRSPRTSPSSTASSAKAKANRRPSTACWRT